MRPHRPFSTAFLAFFAVPVLASLPAAIVFAESPPEVRRDGPLPAQATGATHTLRIIPETCHYLRGKFTGMAAAPYQLEAVARGGGCQARAQLREASVAPSGGGWVLNDVLRVPNAGCVGLQATVRIWRRAGGNAPPASDAQGRSRIYLQDEKQRARSGALAKLGEYVYVRTIEGRPCSG